MSIPRSLIVLLALTVLSVPAWAEQTETDKTEQDKAKPQAVEKVDKTDKADKDTSTDIAPQMKLVTSVVQVMDRRSSIDSILNHCTVELLFIGKPLEQVIGVDHIELSKATDDAGNDLIDKKLQPNRDLGQDDLLRGGAKGPANSAGMSIHLKNPPRSATQIKQLSGIATFVLRSVEGKDFVKLTDFLEQTGKPIACDALKDRGIELIYLPPQWIRDWAAKKDQDVKRPLPAEELAGLLPLIEGVAKQAGTVTLIPMLIKDPKQQLAQVQITTPRGKLRKIQFEHVTVFVSLAGQPDDATLEANLKSDDTTMQLPFGITDVPLP